LIISRFSITSFIGISRTEVAVGIDSEDSMFLAVRIGAPRSRSVRGSGGAVKLAGVFGSSAETG
jgi:hypothetical protein